MNAPVQITTVAPIGVTVFDVDRQNFLKAFGEFMRDPHVGGPAGGDGDGRCVGRPADVQAGTGGVLRRAVLPQVGDDRLLAFSPATVGLTMAEGKQTLAGLQHHLIQAQVEDHCRERRRCSHCGSQRSIKDIRRRRLLSFVRHRRGARPTFRSLPVRRDLPANAQPNHRDHAGPMHAGI
jgi:hypothetical protein